MSSTSSLRLLERERLMCDELMSWWTYRSENENERTARSRRIGSRLWSSSSASQSTGTRSSTRSFRARAVPHASHIQLTRMFTNSHTPGQSPFAINRYQLQRQLRVETRQFVGVEATRVVRVVALEHRAVQAQVGPQQLKLVEPELSGQVRLHTKCNKHSCNFSHKFSSTVVCATLSNGSTSRFVNLLLSNIEYV